MVTQTQTSISIRSLQGLQRFYFSATMVYSAARCLPDSLEYQSTINPSAMRITHKEMSALRPSHKDGTQRSHHYYSKLFATISPLNHQGMDPNRIRLPICPLASLWRDKSSQASQCMVSLTSCFYYPRFHRHSRLLGFNVVATRFSYASLHLGPSPFDAVYIGCRSPSLSLLRLTTICLVDQILMEFHFLVLWFFVRLICAVWNERATLSGRLSVLSEFLSLPSGLSWSSSLVYWVFGCGICLIWCYFLYFVCCEVS
ncbi:hypothetical protein V8F33_001027 [Rhypophila sp. PSN 637]